MLAEIYPIKRLPRRFRTLSYMIPKGMAVERGTIVEIPFRTGTVFGVVASLRSEEASDRSFFAKPILKIFSPLVFSSAEVGWFEALAEELVLHAALPSFPKREKLTVKKVFGGKQLTIPADEILPLSETAKHMATLDRAFIFSLDLRRSAALISAYRKHCPDISIQIIAPHVRDAELLQTHLAHLSPFFLTGEETALKRFRIWKNYRESSNGILIGSRVAALLPHPKLGAVFLVRSSHRDQKQSNQNPRYDARHTASLLSKYLHARLFFLDAAPRTDDLLLFPEARFLRPLSLPQPSVADLVRERLVSPHPILSSTAVQTIFETLEKKKRVLCVYNKRGADNRAAVNILKHQFPKTSIVGLDKEIGLTKEAETADILVATQFYLESIFNPFDPDDFGLVVMLQADFPLFEKTCRALERTLDSAAEWQGAAHGMRAKFLLQSETPRLFSLFFDEPLAALKKDLEQRADYREPPCFRSLAIKPKQPDQKGLEQLRERIWRERPDAIVEKEMNGISVRVHPEAFRALHTLFSRIPDRFIIDTTAD